jgi:general secretion pathway protein B
MSYILDALRKAAEQRGATPTVLLRPSTSLGRGIGDRRAPWIAIATVVVLLNAAALVALLRPGPVTAPAPAAPPVAAIRTVVPPGRPPATQVIEAEPPRRPAPLRPPLLSVTPTPFAQRLPSRPPSEARATVPEPRIPLEAPPASPSPTSRPDTSKLKLEVLSYSDVAAQRLVFINGRRYREGDTIDSGAKIEEIREDGVVLSEQGQRFTLR